MDMTKEELLEKMEILNAVSRELEKLGYFNATSHNLRHFDPIDLAKLVRLHKFIFVIKKRDCGTYPYEVVVPELGAFAIGSAEIMGKAHFMKMPKNIKPKERIEFLEMASKITELELENSKLKAEMF